MFTAKLPQSNKVSQKSLSLSEIHASTFRGISLNPGPVQNYHLTETGKHLETGATFYIFEYKQFTAKNEPREIVKISNPTGIDITETKLDNLISDPEISIYRCCATGRDQNRNGGDVICYANNKICYNTKNFKCFRKISLSKILFQKQNQVQLGLFINLQIKQDF